MSDNGPQFAAEEFQDFCKKNGIRHILIAPYHPASNGLAERGVQTFKRGYKKLSEGMVEDRVARFMLQYATTPHTTTGQSPSELLFGRKLRTRLDSVIPDLGKVVEGKQCRQKENHDQRTRTRNVSIGDKVFARNFRRGKPWLPGVVIRRAGPLSLMVEVTDGRLLRRHLNHLRDRIGEAPPEEPEPDDWVCLEPIGQPPDREPHSGSPEPPSSVRRYPFRVRRPPDRYDPS